MKYYIPTSSLNIESILSTESISPVSYYAERPFGSKFFQRIKGVNMNSYLYLFSKVPLFTIFDAEVEQYSIAIEIDDDEQLRKLDSTMEYDGTEFSIRSCSKTIVLTPWNCRFIYFDERAYRQSRLAIEASRNSKIGLRYPWVYCEEGILLEDLVAKINEDIPYEGPDDLSFNVEKGAAWGFVLGCSRSIPESAAKLVSISNRMRNIASNAISNSGECGRTFYDELKELDKAYRDIADRNANEQWNQFCGPEERSILDKFQVFKEAKRIFLRIKNLTSAPEIPYSKDSKDVWISYRDALNAYTEAFIKKEREASSSVLWDEISFLDGHLSLKNYELINCILRQVSKGELDKEQIRINRESSMKVILGEVSRILQKRLSQEIWNQHPKERLYINQLFKNITDFEPFNLNSIDNEELKAIAAFLLKGEDFDALIRYLEDNSATNYRLVLCLWGALEGYASIHKTLLSPVLGAENVCRVNILLGIQTKNMSFPSEVYTPRLFGNKLSRKQKKGESPKDDVVLHSKTGVHYNEVSKMKDNVVSQDSEDAFMLFFSPFVKQCKAAEKDNVIYRRLFAQYSGITEEFYKAVVSEKSLNKGKGAQNNVIKYIEKLVKKNTRQSTNNNETIVVPKAETSLFSDSYQSTGYFLSDFDYLSNNTEFIAIMSCAKKKWIDDLIWFIDAHKPENPEPHYKGKALDNKTVIIQFINLQNGLYRGVKDFLFRTYDING